MEIWAIFFSGVVGWGLHPGYKRDNAEPLTLEEAALVADAMYKIYQERSWLGSAEH